VPAEKAGDRFVLRAILRYKWIVACVAIAVSAGAVAFAVSQERLYEAEASVLLRLQQPDPEIQGGQGYLPTADQAQRYMATQALVARAPILVDRVIQRAAIPGLTRKTFTERSSVSANPNADVLTFRVTNSRSAVAMHLANLYAVQFAEYRRELDTQAFQSALTGVQDRIATLSVELDEAISQGQSRDPSSDEAAAIQSQIDALRSKEQELQTASALRSDGANVQSEADDADQVQPRPIRDAVLGLLLGLVLGVAAALGMDALNRRPRSHDEVTDALPAPILGVIPTRRRRPSKLAVLDSDGSPEAESYRRARVALEASLRGSPDRLIVLTSAHEADSKSLAAANLALAYARAGLAVILVDADLRRPRLNSLFGIAPSPGITDVLHGSVPLADALHEVPAVQDVRSVVMVGATDGGVPETEPTAFGSLNILPTGQLPPNAADLTASASFGLLLERLRPLGDVVLVDTPPVLPVSDALAICRHADAVVAVVSWRRDTRDVLRAFGDALSTVPAPLVGSIVVGQRDRSAGTGTDYRAATGRDFRAVERSATPSDSEAVQPTTARASPIARPPVPAPPLRASWPRRLFRTHVQ
jgi:Mrp family chromosome partitioning ATPase/capsular polysaccharide biosynthesis protein